LKIRLWKRVVAMLLIAIFALQPFQTMKSYAHDAFFLQVLIDENTYQYQGNVVQDNASFWNKESKHYEAELGDFSMMAGWTSGRGSVPSGKDSYSESSMDGLKEMMFTFPAKEDGGGLFSSKKKNNAEQKDVDRAYLIKETLLPGLNDALRILNNGQPFKSMEELMEMSAKLSAGQSVNGYTITYGKRASYSADKSTFDKKTGISAYDYVVISNGDEEYEFVYRIEKGYREQGSWENDLYDPNRNMSNDAKYISWDMIMYQGNYSYVAKGWTMKDANEIAKVGPLEEAIVDLFQSMFNGLRNLLGLYNMNELIFNEGIRGSSAWVHGAMPKAWHDNVMIYYWVFQGFAWSIIALAIIKQLIGRNLATINPAMRVSLIETIQDLLITAFVLAFLLPLISMLLFMNVKVVDVFAGLAPDFTDLTGLNNYSNAIAGVILQFFYLIVSLYLNFVYIMRSITLAILIAMSPLFVVTIALGGKWKSLFGTWMRELVSNIFLQSFHAFILAFFVTTTVSSRGIEGMVLAFAMIPLTEFFRSLIMGQGGGMAHQLGVRSLMTGGAMVGGAWKGIKSKGGNSNGNGQARNNEQQDSERGTANATEAGSQRYSRNGEQLAVNNKANTFQNSTAKGSHLESHEAKQSLGVPLDVYTKGMSENATEQDKANMDMFTGGESNALKAGIKDAGSAIGSALSPKNIGSAGLGAVQMMAGVGLGLAMGGVSGDAMDSAKRMIGGGASRMSGFASNTASALKSGASSVYRGANMQYPGEPSSSKLKIPEGHPSDQIYDNNAFYRTMGNGNVEVHHDGQVLSEQGIVRAFENNGNTVMQYDMSKLGESDRSNIEYYEKVFNSGDQQQIDWLRQNGVQDVARTQDGNYMVAYNSFGKEQLGFQSMRTTGDGRIVETKTPMMNPVETYKTVNVQQPTPSQMSSPIVDHTGSPIVKPTFTPPNQSQQRPTQRPVPTPPPQPQTQTQQAQNPQFVHQQRNNNNQNPNFR